MDKDVKPTRITTAEGRVYELVPASTKGNENGSVEAGKTTEVTYVYKEIKGNVVVHYTDEAGNTIAEDVKDITDVSISSAYDTTDNKPATITTKDGKKYALVPTATKGAETGKVTEGTTEVTYVYKEIKEETPENPGEKPGNPGTPGTPGENPGTPGNPGTPNTPEKPMDPNSPAKPEGERSPVDVVKSQFKRLANTGNETTNTAAAGFGALIAGIAVVVRRRQKKDK